jgi:membrane protein implicated in regulation of membrane protease activity
MNSIYVFSAIVGGALTLLMVFGVGDVEVDADFDTDFSISGLSTAGDFLVSLLSLRTLMPALAFFGIAGLVLPLAGASNGTTLVLAVVMGSIAGYFNARLMRLLNTQDVNSSVSSDELQGLIGRIIVPIEGHGRGRVTVEVKGRSTNLVAELIGKGHDTVAMGETVVVVDVVEGVARVTPMGDL